MGKKTTLAPVIAVRSIATYAPDALQRELECVQDMPAALAASERYPSLARLRKEHGEGKTEALVKAFLIGLSELVNLRRPLTEAQIDAIARRALTTYYMLTPADLHLLFERALMGYYGEFYESLDVPKVLSWFASYLSERCATACEQNDAVRVWDKGGNLTPERIRKYFNKLEDKINKNKKL